MLRPSASVEASSSFTLNAAPPHVPLSMTTRGNAVESVHYGSVAVVDRSGQIIGAAGDPLLLTMTRSALKPLQAVPFVAADGPQRFGFSQAQVALMCASHSGEPRHTSAVADMLSKIGSSPDELQCGTHPPGFYDARGEIPPPPPWSPLAHNCSGKHAGMLAYCVHCGLAKANYLDPAHPLQQAIRRSVAHFTGIAEQDLIAGVDGCSAPNYGVPLAALARAYACLASERDDPIYGQTPRILADAMTAYPEMVSGEGRNDLALMRAGRGRWVTKIGAEGVQAVGLRGSGIGIAIKVADGAKRGLHPAIVAVLDQLGLMDARQRAELAPWRETTIRNYRGIATGSVKALVVMDKLGSSTMRRRAPRVPLGLR